MDSTALFEAARASSARCTSAVRAILAESTAGSLLREFLQDGALLPSELLRKAISRCIEYTTFEEEIRTIREEAWLKSYRASERVWWTAERVARLPTKSAKKVNEILAQTKLSESQAKIGEIDNILLRVVKDSDAMLALYRECADADKLWRSDADKAAHAVVVNFLKTKASQFPRVVREMLAQMETYSGFYATSYSSIIRNEKEGLVLLLKEIGYPLDSTVSIAKIDDGIVKQFPILDTLKNGIAQDVMTTADAHTRYIQDCLRDWLASSQGIDEPFHFRDGSDRLKDLFCGHPEEGSLRAAFEATALQWFWNDIGIDISKPASLVICDRVMRWPTRGDTKKPFTYWLYETNKNRIDHVIILAVHEKARQSIFSLFIIRGGLREAQNFMCEYTEAKEFTLDAWQANELNIVDESITRIPLEYIGRTPGEGERMIAWYRQGLELMRHLVETAKLPVSTS